MDSKGLKYLIDLIGNSKSNMKPMTKHQLLQLQQSEPILKSDLMTLGKQMQKKHYILMPNILIVDDDYPQHLILQNCKLQQIPVQGFFPLQLEDQNGLTILLFNDAECLKVWYKVLKKQCKMTNLLDQYTIHKRLFPGFHYCVNKKNNKQYLVQVYKKEELYQNIDLWEAVQNEIQILRSIRHQAFLEIKQVYDDELYIFILYYNYQGDSLVQLLNKGTRFDEIQTASIMYQVNQCLKFLNQHQFYHGNLNPSNILINSNNQMLEITIINLSFKEYKLNDKLDWILDRNFEGFIAPEVFEGISPNMNSDIYSLGATLYFVTFFEKLFTPVGREVTTRDIILQLDQFELIPSLIEDCQQYLINQQKNGLACNNVSSSRIELIKKLLSPQEERICLKDLGKHQWFLNIKNKLKAQKVIRKKKHPLPSLKTIIELREQSEQDLRMTIIQSILQYPSTDKIVQFSSKLDGTIFDSDEENDDIVVVQQKMNVLNQFVKHPSMHN